MRTTVTMRPPPRHWPYSSGKVHIYFRDGAWWGYAPGSWYTPASIGGPWKTPMLALGPE